MKESFCPNPQCTHGRCRVLVAVRKPYQAKVFPNAGPMAKSKGKVDEGTGPAELINKKRNSITYLTFLVANTLLVVQHTGIISPFRIIHD